MKQYCKYCSHACQIEIDMCWCEKNNYIIGKEKASRVNKCKDFEFNEIDVFNLEHTYIPKVKRNINQMSLFDLQENEKENK